ncbi:GNAT family N-acetyltransferase [Actinomadura xylanilytica]|uniref:GNAT family N-acetyltransferase n=1 Tax=Actinomadura xylanilytica TaxID=887459 RepID=UPI00255ABE65|nr:GNAT family N-acetyltransferase [Actinomadura xylanilytica]MDL4770817.1 GNAT family N-acetyltransferase [Actinomadura xylanilytica]
MSLRITPLIDPERALSWHRLAWLASASGGAPAGAAFLRLFTTPGQRHLAELQLDVHPAERRAGVGSGLLERAVTAARDDGRRCVIAQADPGSPGQGFLAARGFREVLTLVHSRLPLAEADPAALTAIAGRPHAGYRLTEWDGTVPDDRAAAFAASRSAMDDMPVGDTDYGTVDWDVDRVRAAGEAIARRGDLLHTIAVVDESDGALAGFTELVVPGNGTSDGQHYGTGVLPGHRGRGLGLWMKAASILHARRRHPRLSGLLTDTAEENAPMLAINGALGYVLTHTVVQYQLDL